MNIVLVRSYKHKGAVFLKVEQSKSHFICKIYPQADDRIIKKALEYVPATRINDGGRK